MNDSPGKTTGGSSFGDEHPHSPDAEPPERPAPTSVDKNAASAKVPLERWKASGLTEEILMRPAERRILWDAHERLRQQRKDIATAQREVEARGLGLASSFSYSSHPSHHNTRPSLSIVSEAIFVSSSQAGLGVHDLISVLPRHDSCRVEIDCDRGSHPDPHIPVLRALSAWAKSRMAQEHSENDLFLSSFVQFLQQSLEPKEKRFLMANVPELKKLAEMHESTATNAQWSSSHQSHYEFRSIPSSFSSRHAETLYSFQKKAAVFRPAFAKFVYSLTAASWAVGEKRIGTKTKQAAAETIIVFRNLHRGDEVLLETLRFLLRAQDVRQFEQPILLLVTYQQNPENYMPPGIELAFSELNRPQINKTMIRLEPLERRLLESRLENFLHGDDDETCRALLEDGCQSWLVAKKLEACVIDGALRLDPTTSLWVLEDTLSKQSPSELCGLDQLSDADFQFLQIFSCLGMKTHRLILEHARASDDLDAQLEWAVEEGFLVHSEYDNNEYAFVHEALHDLIYNNIPDEDRPRFHYQVAENLWISFDLEKLDQYMVVVVENVLLGGECLPNHRRRAAVAQLCLRAGELRAEVSAYLSAHFYFSSAIELLPDGWADEYDLSLALYSSTCEVAFCLAMWDDIIRLADVIFANARTFHDTMRAHISKVYATGTQGDVDGSIKYGASLLSRLGEPLPLRLSRRQAFRALSQTPGRLRGLTDEHILRLPAMENVEKISAMRTLNALLPYVFNSNYMLTPLLIDKMIELTLKYGTSAISGVALAMMAAGQCWQGDIAAGQRYGALALKMSEKYKVDSWNGRVATFYYSSVMTWKSPFHELLRPMHAARQVSFACGDIEFAMINANLSCVLELDLKPIPDLLNAIRDFHEIMTKFGQAVNLLMLYPSLLILLSCSGENHEGFTVIQEANQMVGPFDERNPGKSLVSQWCHYARMFVAYLFDDIDGAAKCAKLCAALIAHPVGSADIAMPCLIDGLITVEQCRRQKWKIPVLLPRVRRRIVQLRRFATGSPSNFLGKLYLLQAELASVLGQHERAFLSYTSAIVLMRDSGFYVQLGLANEVAAKHFIRRNDVDRARQHLQEAERIYRSWGGHAKADHLSMQMKSYMRTHCLAE